MAIATGTAILAAGALGAGAVAYGSSQSAKATSKAAGKGASAEIEMFNEQMRLMEPYREAGYAALPKLQEMAFDYTGSPLYKWQLEEGTRALNRQLAARGLYNSGAGLETHRRFLSELGAQESNKMYGRTMDIANLGMGAAGAVAAAAGGLGSSLANIYMIGGAQQAATRTGMYQGLSNQLMGSLGTYLNYGQSKELLDIFKAGYGGYGGTSSPASGTSPLNMTLSDFYRAGGY